MKKRVVRYFFDAVDGQTAWLNRMSDSGWRLVRCGQIVYEFERCAPGEYEYAAEFVADKSHAKAKDYKAFLESVGYRTFYKNIAVGIFIAKAVWRPWGTGAGQIATAPGGIQKELIIAEKKKDGKPFALHTDLTDLLAVYRKIRAAYTWSAGGMVALTLMLVFYAVWMKLVYLVPCAAVCAVLGFLRLMPAVKISKKVHTLKEEAETNEYEAPSAKKRIVKIIIAVAVPLVIILIVFGALKRFDMPVDRYSARNMVQTNWGSRWDASYGYLDGYRQRRATLEEGAHTVSVEITTESGELSLTVTGQDGREYYKASELQTSTFDIPLEVTGKEKLTLRIDAKAHRGSYQIRWE